MAFIVALLQLSLVSLPGREKEDQFLHMVVASFLQKRSLYVSKVEGGYQVRDCNSIVSHVFGRWQ